MDIGKIVKEEERALPGYTPPAPGAPAPQQRPQQTPEKAPAKQPEREKEHA